MNNIKVIDGYYVWDKGEFKDYPFNAYFKASEFECKCEYDTCVEQRISQDLLSRIRAIREELNKPMTVTSAFRCSRHQEALRNSGVNTVVAKKSQHELGNAVDIKVNGLNVNEWESNIKSKFFYYGIAKTFIHVDIRPQKKQGVWVTWKY